MNQSPKVSPKEFAESMREEVNQSLEQIMEAVNQAPDGAWISGSEEPVRDIMASLRVKAFERAVQKRVDAAEAAFPPSTQFHDGKAAGK